MDGRRIRPIATRHVALRRRSCPPSRRGKGVVRSRALMRRAFIQIAIVIPTEPAGVFPVGEWRELLVMAPAHPTFFLPTADS